MARFDLFQGGNRVPMTVEDDPDNVGQYVLPGARALGTPGTGEPAHAGGSTGLIGWARDILAKIAAFGTSGVPSANVISVQGPPNQYGTITFTAINQALTLNCEGMASANFYCRSTGTLGIQIQLDYGDGTWRVSEFLLRSAEINGLSMQYFMVTPALNAWYGCSTKGAKRVRIIAVAWTSGGVFDGVVSASPIYSAVEIAGNTTLSNVTTINTPSSCSVYYTDTTAPLAASALFIGSTRTMLPGNNRFVANFYTDTGSGPASCVMESSHDLGYGFLPATTGATAAPVATISAERAAPYYRLYMFQSATPATVTRILSSQIPN